MPYEAIRNGKHVGISADYIRELQQSTGITFKLLVTDTWQQSLDSLKRGDCQVTSMLNKSPDREHYLFFTEHFFDAANVFVGRNDINFLSGYEGLGSRRLGVVKSYRHAEYVTRYYPELNVKFVDSESDGLLALSSGEIDVFVGSMLSVKSHIQQFGLRDLKIVGLAKPHDKLSMGVSKQHPELVKILDEAIARIPEETHIDIFKQWNNVKVIDHVDYRYSWSLFGFFIVVVLLFGLRNRYVTRFNRTLMVKTEMLEQLQDELLEKNTALEFLSTHDQLTSLYNRHFIIKRCEEEILRMDRFDQTSCFILLDIDHFKQINDTFGHSIGDEVLIQLTTIIQQQIREIDISCRWGGEEFLILCPQTTQSDAMNLAARLRQAVCEFNFQKVGKLTCSFGVAEYAGNESFINWFDRADLGLYEAKSNGRNSIVIADP